ncbi:PATHOGENESIS-RELATED GENE 1, pathogenesis-related gene 1 [Hibiscus trionum]|uniref:Pathogenesis-related protein 1 n=1 Tax=Hibiscus trionum TaxID=183268 RepID=A0A9W7LPC8_HIBTR|nr:PATHOGENESIS-RELATED GENE 1, pathogenesis-related gene 1 [Hibiscus trionum]
MGMSGISQAVFCLIILAIVHTSQAQNSPQDFLNPHNAARRTVNVGPMIWDEKVATYARDYANKRKGDCRLMHSGGPYGENIAWGSGDLSAKGAVDMWVGERQRYNYNSNSCVGGECRHYTQVVWRNSVRLGCAKVRCNNGATFITCNYDPPGNYQNQRPY